MDKVIRDGLVALLYSPGYGAGWYSWNRDVPQILFLPKIVELVETKQHDKIYEVMEELGFDGYFGGAEQLKIQWVPQGTLFQVEEYDGSEYIILKENEQWVTA